MNLTKPNLLYQPEFAYPPEQWDINQLPERLRIIKSRILNNPREIDIERARLTTESYQQSQGNQWSSGGRKC